MNPPAIGSTASASTDPTTPTALREQLSAMADGELPDAEVAAACRACATNADSMADWHAWHLIGDVLRSDDLATGGGRDARFLAALRVGLAQEPVVLAPSRRAVGAMPDVPHARWRRFGLVPLAMAAGFGLVATGLIGVRLLSPTTAPSASYAQTRPTTSPTAVAAADAALVQRLHVDADVRAEPQAIPASSKLIRDARLDRYLAAHQQFAGDSALSVPTAFLRNAAVDAPR